jgi:hypothetical protein
MSVGLRLYEQLSEAQDDKTRARLIAEAFDALENLYPHLQDLATQGHLRETELRLQKEIKEVEAKLHKEIREVEAALRVEIEKVRLEIKSVEVKVAESKAELVRWVVGVGLLQTTLLTAVLLRIAHLI